MGGGSGGDFRNTRGGQWNTRLHMGRQGKHIRGHNNFKEGRSELTISPEEAQSLIDQFSGTGQKIGANKERVDFGKTIGLYFSQRTGKYYDTSMGIIHYSSEGAHIVPATPKDWEEE